MNFGDAIAIMKEEGRVARQGWNGKGMFLYLVEAGRYPPSTPAGAMLAAQQPDGLVPYAPYIAMKTVTDEVVPWLASQTDMLAEDWAEVVTVKVGVKRHDILFDHEEEEQAELINPLQDEDSWIEKYFGGNQANKQEAREAPASAPEEDECRCLSCTLVSIIQAELSAADEKAKSQ